MSKDTLRVEVIPDDEPIPMLIEILSVGGVGYLATRIKLASAPVGWWPQLKNVPSHSGLLVTWSNGRAEVWETHAPDGWRCTPWEHYKVWMAEDNRRWVRRRVLDLNLEEREDVVHRCREKLDDPFWRDYPEGQILAMLRHRVAGIGVPHSPSPVCSEAVARLLFPYYDVRVWPGRSPRTFDEITPWWLDVIPLVRRGA